MTAGRPVTLTIPKINAMDAGDEMWDAIISGLHVRAGKKTKSFLFYYRTSGGKERRPTIGKYGPITLDKARNIAKNWAGIVAEGRDPAEERSMQKDAILPATLKCLKARYEAEVKKADDAKEALKNQSGDKILGRLKKRRNFTDLKENSKSLYETLWKHIMTEFGEDKKLSSFTREEISQFLEKRSKRIPDPNRKGFTVGGYRTANITVRFLTSLLRQAVKWEIGMGIDERAYTEPDQFEEFSRERYLTPEEAPRFFAALEKFLKSENRGDRAIGRLAHLCLFNAARRGEFQTSRLSWIDWADGTLALPDSKTGARVLDLSNENLTLLKVRYEEWQKDVADGKTKPEDDWVIPGKHHGKPLTQPKKPWERFLKEAKIQNLHLHDLRHTFPTIGVNMGAGDIGQMSRILGHSSEAMTKRYTHLMRTKESRKVINDTVEHIKNMKAEDTQHINDIVPESIRLERENFKRLQETPVNLSAH